MSRRITETPEEAMRRVTEEIIRRAIRLGRKKGREITISKTSRGRGVPVADLNPAAPGGRERLDRYLERPARHYTIAGLGDPEEPNAINWRLVNASTGRRIWSQLMIGISFLLKGNMFKNRFYRWMGVHIGRNTEIMQMVWLDHFRPELIFIGDHTLLGAFTQVTVHAYEGCGRFRYGLVEIGSHCTIGAGSGLGVIRIEDNVRVLPGTVVSPYFPRLRSGSVVGYAPPPVKRADDDEKSTKAEEADFNRK